MIGQLESEEEFNVFLYLEELEKQDIIQDLNRGKTINIEPDIIYHWNKIKTNKKGTTIISENSILLSKKDYTCDFTFKCNIKNIKKYQNLFFLLIYIKESKSLYSYLGNKIDKKIPFIAIHNVNFPIDLQNIDENTEVTFFIEVKPSYDRNHTMTKEMPLIRKMFYKKYKKYINIIQVENLFKTTFTPEKFLLTPTGRQRKLNFTPTFLKNLIKTNDF